jgi:hypothetical protein
MTYPQIIGHQWALLLVLQVAVSAVGGLPAEEEEDDAEGDADVDQDDQAEQRVRHHWKAAYEKKCLFFGYTNSVVQKHHESLYMLCKYVGM